MNESALFVNHCPTCGGGIEFPANGVGMTIPCAHCHSTLTLGFPVGQNDSPTEQLNAFLRCSAVPIDVKVLLDISLFSSPTTCATLTCPRIGSCTTEAEAIEKIGRYVAEGLLEDVSTDVLAILRTESSKTLKALAKERCLPTSGTKDKVARRLVDADPQGMGALIAGCRYFACTIKGTMLVEKWNEADSYQKKIAENESLQALRAGCLKDACMAVANYEASRMIPRGFGIDWKNYDASHDMKVLQIIASAQLRRHAESDQSTMQTLRVAAGMIHLWGTNTLGDWLPESFSHARHKWAVEARMLLFHANHQLRLAQMLSVGIQFVETLGPGTPDCCRQCRTDSGKKYQIEKAPVLPHERCTCEDGCRCLIVGIGS